MTNLSIHIFHGQQLFSEIISVQLFTELVEQHCTLFRHLRHFVKQTTQLLTLGRAF